jgi:hypothetical protein
VNEFLAIERDHRATLREGRSDQMLEETAMIRARHGPINARDRRWASFRGGVWRRAWFRTNWTAFLVQSMLPSRMRGRSWRRLLAVGNMRLSPGRVLAMLLIPVGGRRLRTSLVAPSRYWLEPPS